MKKGIHPAYEPLRLILPNGDCIDTRGAVEKPTQGSIREMRLSIGHDTHRAWNPTQTAAKTGQEAKRFADRYQGASFLGIKK